MYQSVNQHDFTEAFRNLRPHSFSYAGQKALFDYLKELEEDTGEAIELDVIALCCDYAEYENLEEFKKDYDSEEYETLDDVREQTTVIAIPGSDGFIIQQF